MLLKRHFGCNQQVLRVIPRELGVYDEVVSNWCVDSTIIEKEFTLICVDVKTFQVFSCVTSTSFKISPSIQNSGLRVVRRYTQCSA